MSFRSLEEETPVITVQPPVEDVAKSYYDPTQFFNGEDQLNNLVQLEDTFFNPMVNYPGSPFSFEDDSTDSTPPMWAARSPADPNSPNDFEQPLDDFLNSPRSPLDLSPTRSSPLSLTLDEINITDDTTGAYLYFPPAFRNRSYSEPGTVAPRDILTKMDPLSLSQVEGINTDGLDLVAPLFEGDVDDIQVVFGQPVSMASQDVVSSSNSSALFSGNLGYPTATAQDSIPIAPSSSQQPVYLNVHQGPTKHRHSLSESNLTLNTSRGPSLSANSSPRVSESRSLSVQTQFSIAQQNSTYLSPDAESGWHRTRMRSNSASGTIRHTPYTRTSPRKSSDQLPLADETDLHRHASDPTGSNKYGAARATRSSKRRSAHQPGIDEIIPASPQSSLDARSLASAPHSPVSPSISTDAEATSNITKLMVASQKCKDASEKRRTANKPLFACSVEGCTSTFTAKHNVVNHLNSHFGVRPYPCKYCDGTFATSGTCNRHEKNCSGRKRSQ